MQVIESILADAAQIAALRRDIHAHPELCFEEKRTSDLIAEQLTSWGIPIHRGLGTTGIVAILKNGTSSRAVGMSWIRPVACPAQMKPSSSLPSMAPRLLTSPRM